MTFSVQIRPLIMSSVKGDVVMVEGISKDAQLYLDFADRIMRIYAALGVDYLERALIITATKDPGPWGASALAAYIGQNRTTVYRRLVLRESQGVIHRVEGKWTPTPDGRAGAIRLVNEVGRTAVRGTPLSEELVQLCATLNPRANIAEARLLQFSPLIIGH